MFECTFIILFAKRTIVTVYQTLVRQTIVDPYSHAFCIVRVKHVYFSYETYHLFCLSIMRRMRRVVILLGFAHSATLATKVIHVNFHSIKLAMWLCRIITSQQSVKTSKHLLVFNEHFITTSKHRKFKQS